MLLDVLIAFRLQEDHYFLYPTVSGRPLETIIQECSILYEFVRKYPIIDVIEHVGILDALEIDKHVKTYMKEKGVDKVRGGTYTDVVYPDSVKEFIENELKLSFHQYYLHVEKIQSIVNDTQLDSVETIVKKQNDYMSLMKKHTLLTSVYLNFNDDIEWMLRCSIFDQIR